MVTNTISRPVASYAFPRPIASVDVVLFTVVGGHLTETVDGEEPRSDASLRVVLTRRRSEPFRGALAIPGSFVHVDVDKDMEATATRALREKCGVSGLFVEQLRTYSGKHRDSRGWSLTTAYYALVPYHLLAGASSDVSLVPIESARGLPFDHDNIVADALERIRGKASYTTLPAKLLKSEFTLLELEEAYEALLGRKMITAGFRRKMADLEVPVGGVMVPYLQKTEGTRRYSGRPAALYRKAVEDVVIFPQIF